MSQVARIAHPVRSFNEELATLLRADVDFVDLVPGGIHTETIQLDRPALYPEMFVRPAPDAPGYDFRTNIAVVDLQRVEWARADAVHGVQIYTRLEVRGPRGATGRSEIAAVWAVLDRLHRQPLRIGPYRPRLEMLGDSRAPINDRANELGVFSWADCSVRLAMI